MGCVYSVVAHCLLSKHTHTQKKSPGNNIFHKLAILQITTDTKRQQQQFLVQYQI